MWWRAGIAAVGGVAALVLAGCTGSGNQSPPPPSATGSTTPGSSPAATSSLSPLPRVFDQAALQDGVRRVLVQSYQLTDVGPVRCPSGQAVQAGISFDCTAVVGGVTKTVTLTVRGADGTYEVSAPK